MAKRVHPKQVFVEGEEDKRVIPELIEANGVPWGTRGEEVVHIKVFDGISNVAGLAGRTGPSVASGGEVPHPRSDLSAGRPFRTVVS